MTRKQQNIGTGGCAPQPTPETTAPCRGPAADAVTTGSAGDTIQHYDPLLTLGEVLNRVRHKKSWLYEKIGRGEFPAGFHLGRRRFWRESVVEEALRKLLVPASVAPQGPKISASRSKALRGCAVSNASARKNSAGGGTVTATVKVEGED